MSDFWCELAWLGSDKVESGVLLSLAGERIEAVSAGIPEPPVQALRLPGLTLPGLANSHSHVFQRALRGRTHAGTGSFWTWRKQMYRVAARLDPESYHKLARATFAEMALAGFTLVGEFHYLHHQPSGAPYAQPNVMGEAVLAGAREAGVRLTLLDTCYLHGGLDPSGYRPVEGVQRRFADRDAPAWVERASALKNAPEARTAAAIHSLRAVDPHAIQEIRAWCRQRDAPLHAHVSEQPAENQQCVARHGRTPVRVLADLDVVGERFTAVHATHLDAADIQALGAAGATCCFCPTTERDLADGVGPSAALTTAGARLALGTDSHAVVDPFEEARAVELDQRLASLTRGHHTPSALLAAATRAGYACLGWPEGGQLAAGGLADFVTISLESTRLAGITPDNALASTVFAASAADVTHVVVAGKLVVRDSLHCRIDAASELGAAIPELYRE